MTTAALEEGGTTYYVSVLSQNRVGLTSFSVSAVVTVDAYAETPPAAVHVLGLDPAHPDGGAGSSMRLAGWLASTDKISCRGLPPTTRQRTSRSVSPSTRSGAAVVAAATQPAFAGVRGLAR